MSVYATSRSPWVHRVSGMQMRTVVLGKHYWRVGRTRLLVHFLFDFVHLGQLRDLSASLGNDYWEKWKNSSNRTYKEVINCVIHTIFHALKLVWMFLRSEKLRQWVFAAELFTFITNFLKFPTNSKVSNSETVRSSTSIHALPVQRLNITLEGRRLFLGAFKVDH